MTKTGDKRSVSTDALETLGNIIDDNARRDAIHLAVEPAIAAHTLRPGEDVGFIGGDAGVCENPVGIVDPFLKTLVQKGQRFWLVVYPRKITSLRHVWSHPAFDDAAVAAEPSQKSKAMISKRWIDECADRWSKTGDEMIQRATDFLDGGGYWSDGGLFEGELVPDDFWSHYQAVTGRLVEANDRESFFSCSC